MHVRPSKSPLSKPATDSKLLPQRTLPTEAQGYNIYKSKAPKPTMMSLSGIDRSGNLVTLVLVIHPAGIWVIHLGHGQVSECVAKADMTVWGVRC